MSGLRFTQVGLNSSDIAGSLRFYSEVFGFSNAGGQTLWGEIMRLQGLDPSTRTLMWWMVGRQRLVQLELFFHGNPPARPLRADWSPADHGWTRMGIAVADFERAMAALSAWNVAPISPPVGAPGCRRAAIRDPFVGIVIEMIEESDALGPALRHRHFDLEPMIVYVAASVSNLERARHFYGDLLGLRIVDEQGARCEQDDALWGLGGARRRCFIADAGDVKLEISEYAHPVGRPRPEDHRASDQGIMNVALRSENRDLVAQIIDRLIAEDHDLGAVIASEGTLGTYCLAPDREVELLACPSEDDATIGFAPVAPFFGDIGGSDLLAVMPASEFRKKAFAGGRRPSR